MARGKDNTLQNKLTKDKLAEAYSRLGSCKAVGREMGCAGGTVKSYMLECGLYVKPQIRYNCNHDFFSINNEQSFYWAGFIAADGCVLDQRASNILFIGLSEKDHQHLIKIKKALAAQNPIGSYHKDYPSCELRITSDRLCSDLKRFNIVPRKSHIYTFPEWLIDHKLVRHFMRGYFDGDGSLYYSKIYGGRTERQLFFSLRGTTKFLEVFRMILETQCALPKRNKDIRVNSGIGVLEYGGNDVTAKICNFLYKDATVCLDRKREIAQQIITRYSKKLKLEEKRKKERELKQFRKAAHKWMTSCHISLDKENLAKLYQEHQSIQKIAQIIQKRQKTTKQLLLDCGVELIKRELNLDESKLRQLYNKYQSMEKVAEELGCSFETVRKYIHQYGIEKRSTESNKHDHNFFSIDNESRKQFYFAGRILGKSTIDGSTIILTSKNKSELENFVQSGMTSAPINKMRNAFRISISSDQIVQDLNTRFGINSDKNMDYQMPGNILSHKFLSDFIRGRLDAKSSRSERYMEINGSDMFLGQLSNIFHNKCGTKIKNIRRRKNKNSYRLIYTNTVEIYNINQYLS